MARSKRMRKISLPAAFDSQAFQAVASGYSDWDILAHNKCLLTQNIGFYIICISIILNFTAILA